MFHKVGKWNSELSLGLQAFAGDGCSLKALNVGNGIGVEQQALLESRGLPSCPESSADIFADVGAAISCGGLSDPDPDPGWGT